MYKLLLTFRYLRRKLIPIFALLAVTLCTAMVIIVISVMGGFLDMVKNAGRNLMGDVSMYAGLGGFPRYEEMIEALEKEAEVESTTPIIVAYGLVKIGTTIKGVQVYGIDGEGADNVTRYRDTLQWDAAMVNKNPSVARFYGDADPLELGVGLHVPGEGDRPLKERTPALAMGIEVSPYNTRTSDGSYAFPIPMPGEKVTLTVLPVTSGGGMTQPSTDQFTVVNEFMSGVYDVDSQRVYIPFGIAQQMMLMDESDRVDRTTFEVIGKNPARATELHIRAAEGVSAEQLQATVQRVYAELGRKHQDLPPMPYMQIATWQQRQAGFLRAVENEKGLMTVLFGIISIVAVVMIGVVFYMIVLEKTRDIGILRAIGASRMGVASIFLMFGGVIGTIGAAGGTLIAWLIVTNINEIHAWLGDTFGVVIWDRSVYFFDRIPSQVNWNEITVIVIVAITASVFGALVPAIKAARVDPIESLRYE